MKVHAAAGLILLTTTLTAAEPARVYVTSTPKGAKITLKDKDLGTTPAIVNIKPGTHQLTLTKTNYKPTTITINATRRGITKTGNIQLTPANGTTTTQTSPARGPDFTKFGKIYVRSDPPGALIQHVWPDGVITKCSTTPKLLLFKFKKVKLRLTKDGYTPVTREYALIEGSIIKPEPVKLKPATRRIDVMYKDEGWTVLLNGKPMKDTLGKPAMVPCTVEIPVGATDLRLWKARKEIPFRLTSESFVEVEGTPRLSRIGKPGRKAVRDGDVSKYHRLSLWRKFDFENYTEEFWNKVPGKIMTVKANEVLDTGITLKKGQALVVLPHPTDKWKTGPHGQLTTYRGYKSKWDKDRFWANSMFMAAITKSNNRFYKYGLVRDPKNVMIMSNDRGLHDSSGFIRIKLIILK